MSVSLAEVLAGARARQVPLASEYAGYLVLAAADQAAASPRRVEPDKVRLCEDGSVRLDAAKSASETDAERDLRSLLDELLLAASGPTPALLRASRRASGRGVAALVREIETALIPVNRSAARRALARLERETAQARERLPSETFVRAPRVEQPAVASSPRPAPSAEAPAAVESASLPAAHPPVVESAAKVLPDHGTAAIPVAAPALAPVPTPIPESTELLLAAAEHAPEPSASAPVLLDEGAETRPEPLASRASVRPAANGAFSSRTPLLGSVITTDDRDFVALADDVLAAEQSEEGDDVEIEVVFEEEDDEELTAAFAFAKRSADPTSGVAEPPDAAVSQEDDAAASERPGDLTEPCPPALDGESPLPLPVLPELPPAAAFLEPPDEAFTPPPRLPLPKPRKSDVSELLNRLDAADSSSQAELRANLKDIAGLDPTAPPPLVDSQRR